MSSDFDPTQSSSGWAVLGGRAFDELDYNHLRLG